MQISLDRQRPLVAQEAEAERIAGGRRQSLGRQLCGLLAALLILDLLARLAVAPMVLADGLARASTLWRVALYQQTPAPVDVLIMGSSRVQLGFSPVMLAQAIGTQLHQPVRILNLGMKLGTPQSNYWMLKNVINDKNKQPRIIIYGAAEYEFNENLHLSTSYDYSDELASLSDYPEAFPDPTQRIDEQLGFLVGRPWYLFRNRNAIRDAIQDRDAPDTTPWPAGMKEDPYGYVPADTVMSATEIARMRGQYLDASGWGLLLNYKVGPPMTTRFEQFLQLAQARGIQVIVLNMPVTRVHESWLSRQDYAAYRAYLQQTAAKYGMPYVDYNHHELWDEPHDWRDTNHLNNWGATKFSRMVGTDVLTPALRQLGWK